MEGFVALPQRKRRRERKHMTKDGGLEEKEPHEEEKTVPPPSPKRVAVESTNRGVPLSAAAFAEQLDREKEEADAIADEFQYEYLDHTADVQIHAWGDDCGEAFAQAALGMMGYITNPASVDIVDDHVVEATGHDALSLFFNFLDEVLFSFASDDFVARGAVVEELIIPDKIEAPETAGDGAHKPGKPVDGAASMERYRIRVRLQGEKFNLSKHPQGTEIKAITFSNMQILPPTEKEDSAVGAPVPNAWNVYVIVDI